MYSKDDDFNKYDSLMNKIEKKDYPIPDEFDAKINARIQGLRRKNSSLHYAFAASVLIMVVIVSSINLFPSLATYASGIPGIGGIIEWLVIDKGVQVAESNGYKDLGPIIVEKDGYTLTLESIFFDDSRIRLSALLTGNEISENKISLQENTSSKDQKTRISKQGNSLGGISYNISFDDFRGLPCRNYSRGENKGGILANSVELEITQKDKLLKFLDNNPSSISLTATIYKGGEKINEIRDIKIPVRRENILFSKSYPFNKNISFGKGDVLVKGLIVSPTRITLEVECISKEDSNVEGFDKIYLRDDKGNIYTCVGTTVDKSNNNIKQYYFVPSIYFNTPPKKLYFCYEGLRVATKAETTLKINLSNNYPKIIKYMGEDIILEDVQQLNNGVLQVTMDFPSHETLQVGSVMLSYGDTKISSNRTNSTSGKPGRIKLTEYFHNVPILSEYKIELSKLGYFVPLTGETELIID